METLGKLFGGVAKVKIMRLFLFHAGMAFDIEDVAHRSAVSIDEARRDIKLFEQAGFVQKKAFVREDVVDGVVQRTRCQGWELDPAFPYLTDLRALLVHSVFFTDNQITKKLARAGALKFVAIAGVFIQNPESRVDLFLVGDKLKERVIENVVRSLEAEIGKELRYAILETDDFKYRLGVFDKLVRDVLDYPHRTILDRIGIKEH